MRLVEVRCLCSNIGSVVRCEDKVVERSRDIATILHTNLLQNLKALEHPLHPSTSYLCYCKLLAELRDATGDDPRELLFTKDIARGEICVFVPGYLEYLAETNHTVNSVLGFMPGVRVSIATGIFDFHVYNR